MENGKKKNGPAGRRSSYSKEQMIGAIKMVREKKMGYQKAAKLFQVPKTTLIRLSDPKYGEPEVAVMTKIGGPTVLTPHLEEELVKYCLNMEKSFFGLTRTDLRRMAYQLAERNGLSHPFANENAGRKWMCKFMKRHEKKLSFRKPTGTSFARAVGFTRKNVNSFFDIYEPLFEKYNYPPDRIYNVDESGLTVVQSKIPQIIGLRGKKQIGDLTAAERGSLITIVVCMSAAGNFVPPLVIFPRKNRSAVLEKGAPVGTIFRTHKSGWIQMEFFTDWFNHFIDYTKPSESSPVLLVLDGHYTHTRNMDIVDLARQHFVTIISLPPHCTHKMQPLDRTFLGPLKTYYSEAIRRFSRQENRPVANHDIMTLFCDAYIQCQTAQIAINGFKATGLYPIDRNKFKEDEFIDEAYAQVDPLYDHIEDELELENDHAEPSDDTISESIGEAILHSVPPTPDDNPSTSLFQPISPDSLTSSSFERTPSRPSTSGSSLKIVSPQDINPLPRIQRKNSGRGKKPSSATVLTSSPYKKLLMDALAKKNQPKSRGGKTGTRQGRGGKKEAGPGRAGKKGTEKRKPNNLKKKAKVVISDEDSDDDGTVTSGSSAFDVGPGGDAEEDAECMFCNEKWSTNTGGEPWIQCVSCSQWAHVDCSGAEREQYICDFCICE